MLKYKLLVLSAISAAFFTQPASSALFDIQFTGTITTGVGFYRSPSAYSTSFTNSFVSSQYDVVSNSNTGLAYDFVFRFDTDAPFISDFSLPAFNGGRSFDLISASFNSIDFSSFETQVVQFGTNSSGGDTINFLLWQDVDEAQSLPGAWGSQINFKLYDADGELIPALLDIENTPFDGGIDFSEEASFFISRNRNGIYTGQQYGVSNSITITSVSTGTGGGSVPEPSVLALMTAGFAGIGFAARRRKS